MKEKIVSPAVPAPALPFSPGLKVGEWVFLSGQGGFDAEGRLPETIEEETEQTLANVAALLEAAGCALDDVVSCLVHLTDLSLFPGYNAVYERHFAEPRPVRTTVGAQLVAGMRIEITAVARVPGGTSG
jgi:2-iminobutanoate/2-iminopropanoate deaminase